MTQTIAEWLEKRFEKFLAYYEGHHKAEMYSIHQLSNDFNQAKEMEKQQRQRTIEEVFEWLTKNNYVTDLKETLIDNFNKFKQL